MFPKRKTLIFQDSFQLTNFLIKKWKEIANESISKNNRFVAALSGGKTPVEFYCRLSGINDFDIWQKTHIFLTDERYVPYDDPRSNLGMIRKNILDYISIPDENIHPMGTYNSDINLSCELYENHIRQFFELEDRCVPSFDFVLLGIGDDGHVASLFPWGKEVHEIDDLVTFSQPEYLDTKRMSMTLAFINNARHVVVLVTGNKKAEIIKKVIEEKEENSFLPATKVAPRNGELLFLLDNPAASKLSYGERFSHDGQAISI
ncbi:MAG: 6-phosphogluconolactonase [Omnitrophica WOR_2 bacterium GWA2_37_7]|nr:MAG: 6-phosphogluconolactonase [Omnitrophica WOR_2 bacterium GWA2_37_7]